MKEKVSVIIVNYNGKQWLEQCINSVQDQDYKNFEILLIDNASEDDSAKNVERKYRDVVIYKNNENVGFAGGCNTGMKHATGKYLLLLNTDAVLESNFLTEMMKAFEENQKLAIAQSKIVYMDDHNKIDTCGSFWTNTSLLYHYGNSKDARNSQYNKAFPVFSVKGVAVLIKRSIAENIGLFDDDFWCYYEETDFCQRAWLSGYEVWYWPKSVVYHAGGGTSLSFPNDFVQFHNFKNKLLSFLKNFELSSLFVILPTFLIMNVVLSLYWLLMGKHKHTLSLYKAILWNIQNLKKTIHKRKQVQKLRTVKDNNYYTRVKKNPKLSYYKQLLSMRFEEYKDQLI